MVHTHSSVTPRGPAYDSSERNQIQHQIDSQRILGGLGFGKSDTRRSMSGAEKLRLLSVCDKETGVCLFQRAWQWRGDQERPSIGKLVQSFYQFAREVDQGGICLNHAGPNCKAKLEFAFCGVRGI